MRFPVTIREHDLLADRKPRVSFRATEMTLEELLGPIDEATYVEVDGEWVRDGSRVVRHGDFVDFARFPRGPFAVPLFSVGGTAGLFTAGAIKGAAFTLTIGKLIAFGALGYMVGSSLLHRPHVPSLSEERSGFTTAQSTSADGARVPLVFGQRRMIGRIIESYVAPVYRHTEKIGGTDITVSATRGDEDLPLNTRVLWCQGPIFSITLIRVDDNPIEDISDVTPVSVLGTNLQGQLDGFEEAKNPIDPAPQQVVSVADPPGSHSATTEAAVDAVEIELFFHSGFRRLDTTSFPQMRSVDVSVVYQIGSQPSVNVGTFPLSDDSLAPVSKWLRIDGFKNQIVTVTVGRGTADNSDSLIEDEFRFENLVQISSEYRAYPGLAMTGIVMIPQQNSAPPQTYSAVIKGLANLRIYSSTSAYTEGWSDNPAWVFLHLFGNPVALGREYGYGRCDIQSFIDFAAYCTTNGLKCNWAIYEINALAIWEAVKAYNAWLVDDLGGGKIRVVIDEASSEVAFLTPADYEIDSFSRTEAGSYRATRYIASIPGDAFDGQTITVVHTSTGIADDDDFVQVDVDLPGITSTLQAERALERAARKALYETATIQFVAGRKAIPIRVGEVFAIAAPECGYTLAAGKVLQVAGSGLIELDQPFVRESGKSYEVTHLATNGTISTFAVTPEVAVGQKGNWVDSLSAPETIVAGDTYSLSETSFSKRLFRCISRRDGDDEKITITATTYATAVYATSDVEAVVDPGTPSGVDPNVLPPVVQNLTLAWQNESGGLLLVHWTPPDGVASIDTYEIWVARSGTPYRLAVTTRNNHGLVGAPHISGPETYTVLVKVRAITNTGRSTSIDDSTGDSIVKSSS